MNLFKLARTLLLTIGLLSSVNLLASPDVSEIVSKSNLAAYYAGDDGKSAARMIIIDKNGNKQMRQFSILRKDITDGDDQKFLVVFSRPADIKGTTFLVLKHTEGDDDRWLYLPALDLVKRISAGDKRTSFVGSHYFYEDVSGRSPAEDKHELLEEKDGKYLLKHTPRNPNTVEFSYYLTWIDKANFIPVKIEYYDQNGKAFRLIEATKIANIQGIPTVQESKVTNLTDGSYTVMQFRKTKYDLGLPDEIFTERSLRNPPVKWLRK